MIEKAGVRDEDVVFLIDIGPNIKRAYVSRETVTKTLTVVEISDEPILIRAESESGHPATEAARKAFDSRSNGCAE